MGNAFKKLKQLFNNAKISIKNNCLSSCCIWYNTDADINVDINGDKIPDLHIGIHQGIIEVNRIKQDKVST